jgi:hypothetical protein
MFKSHFYRLTACVALSLTSALVQAHPSTFNACSGPDDPEPCIVTAAAPDLSRLPAAGPAAWVDGDRIVISWVGKADTVRVMGTLSGLVKPMPIVAGGLHQLVIRFKQAQQVHVQLVLLVAKDGKNEAVRLPDVLVGPAAAPAVRDSGVAARTIVFKGSTIPVHVWLPRITADRPD